VSQYHVITISHTHNQPPDLQSFREALQVLQRQVDDLDELKARHYQEIMEHEEEIWDFVQGKVSSVRTLTQRSDCTDIFCRYAS
jgi:hypothetical protein